MQGCVWDAPLQDSNGISSPQFKLRTVMGEIIRLYSHRLTCIL